MPNYLLPMRPATDQPSPSAKPMTRGAKIGHGLALAALLGASVLFLLVMGSLPRLDGKVSVRDLEHPVRVTHDMTGVPRIFARSLRDGYFALGWIHAQNRLWQMEFQRRVATGQLSEVVGPQALKTDLFTRTLGLAPLAQASLNRLDHETMAALQAYTDGVNGWIQDNPTRLPPEFLLLGYRPAPWTPADSLAWARLMAFRLSNDWQDKILRSRLAATIPERRLNQLFPTSQPGQPQTLGMLDGLDGLLAAIPDQAAPRQASNVWVVSGARTASGKPLLANDPHLEFQAPGLWYLAAMEAPGLSVTGATIPGLPFHIIGHNGHVAWGITASQADTIDLFVEKPVSDTHYQTPQGPRPFEVRNEEIKIKGQPSYALTVRTTRHGPIISDLIGMAQPVALQSTALIENDQSAAAFYKINRATDWKGFVAGLKPLSSPVQNLAYADTTGRIGFITAGRVPVRPRGFANAIIPGWTGDGDWQGFVAFEQMPQRFASRSDSFVNANNSPQSDKKGPPLAAVWPDGYRAQRITDLLGQRRNLTADHMAAIQMDMVSLAAQEIREAIGVIEPSDPRVKQALALLDHWDGSMDRTLPQPLIWAAWMEEMWRLILADELGDGFASMRQIRPQILVSILTHNRHWCDDITTPQAESCADMAEQALQGAVKKLSDRFGPTMEKWQWGMAHQARLDHPILGQIPGLSGWSNIKIAADGDNFTVNRGMYRPDSFEQKHGAGLRAIFDLDDLSASRFIIAGGQSGNPLSRHYDDLMERWQNNRTLQPDKPQGNVAVLNLAPLSR